MRIALIGADDPRLRSLIQAQQAELAGYAAGPPPRAEVEYVAGYMAGRPVACGGLQRIAPGTGEIRRMYVRPEYRRRGFSRLILAALEDRAVAQGYERLLVATAAAMSAAVSLYRAAGYQPVPVPDGDPARICFEKSIRPPTD